MTNLIESRFRAMGSEILAMLETDNPQGQISLARLPEWFERWESRFSRFRPESELNALKEGAGAYQRVTPLMFEVIQRALRSARLTGGIVAPTLLDPLEAAGYDRSFEQITGHTHVKAHPPTRAGDWRGIKLNRQTRSIYLPAGVRLDLGGFAKGWAATRAVHKLSRFGACLVDAGGDIAVSGPRSGGSAWPIAVASPWEPERDLALLNIARGGVATSGRDRRRWLGPNGTPQHHLIDPQTMKPAQTDILTATVVGPSLEIAETAAKAVLLQGSQQGIAWLKGLGNFGALLALDNGQLMTTRPARPLPFLRKMELTHA